ncbi:MAG: hypothetical protein HYY55_03600 [Candidatus Niyogibacteria bacterium]|nr:MAG: hypothetical protein HYY55_03600 [Candidatus Niyogibacteria bacterium]
MLKESLKNKIKEILEKMGCVDIQFSNGTENEAAVRFNCEILISFKTDLEDWIYSGIQRNDLGEQKYKIGFKRKSN